MIKFLKSRIIDLPRHIEPFQALRVSPVGTSTILMVAYFLEYMPSNFAALAVVHKIR